MPASPVFSQIILSGASVTSSGNRLVVGVNPTLMVSDSGAINARIAATGAAAVALNLSTSGALASQIAGGGTSLTITGSAAMTSANFTGLGSVSVQRVGDIVIISGAATAGGGSSPTWTELQIDFGTGKPVYDKTFVITDSGVSIGSKIVVLPCGKTASGQQDGDWLWDGLTLAALPGTGNFTLFAAPTPGPIKGQRVIQYQVTT